MLVIRFPLLFVVLFGVPAVMSVGPPIQPSPNAVFKGSPPPSTVLASVPLNRLWQPLPQVDAKFTGSTPDTAFVNFNFNLNKDGFNVETNGEVKDMSCTGDTISLKIPNATALQIAGTWKPPFALLTPAKWPCNNKATNQWFTVNSLLADQASQSLKLTVDPSSTNDHAQTIDWNLSAPIQATRRRKRLFTVAKSLSFDVNANFDGNKATKANIPIIQEGPLLISCANCFSKGNVVLTANGQVNLLKKSTAVVTLDGDFAVNLEVGISGQKDIKVTPKAIQVFDIPLSPLSVPGLLNVGPEITLQAQPSLDISLNGEVSMGVNIAFSKFHGVFAVGADGGSSSGFTPVITPIDPKIDSLSASATLDFDLTPQLAIGVDIADGAFKVDAGIQAGARLQAKASAGTGNRCTSTNQLNLNLGLTGDVGGFVNSPVFSKTFTFAQFPTADLFDKCFGVGGASNATAPAVIAAPPIGKLKKPTDSSAPATEVSSTSSATPSPKNSAAATTAAAQPSATPAPAAQPAAKSTPASVRKHSIFGIPLPF